MFCSSTIQPAPRLLRSVMNTHSPPSSLQRIVGDANTSNHTTIDAVIRSIEASHEDLLDTVRALRQRGDAEFLQRLKGKYPNDDPSAAKLSPYMSLHYSNAHAYYDRAVKLADAAKFVIMDYKRYVEWAFSKAAREALQGDAGAKTQAFDSLHRLARKLRVHQPKPGFIYHEPDHQSAPWTPKQARTALRTCEAEVLTQMMRFARRRQKMTYGLRAVYLVRRYADTRAWHRLSAAFRSNDHYCITVIVQAISTG